MSKRTELKTEFFGISAINSLIANVSSPRAVMDVSHFSGRPALLTPDEPFMKSGIEYELGKTINHPTVPQDCTVKAIIPRYREYGFAPPEVTLLVEYERAGNLYIDIIHVPAYNSTHNVFGYRLHYTEELQNLQFNSPLAKDTVLAASDSYGPEGCYMYGLNANTVFMSHPSVSDDGYVISESFAKRAAMFGVTKRVINITKNTIPVNVNGDMEHFKFIPEPGDYVRPDGLLCATRERNDWFSVSDLNSRNLCQVDMTFDTLTYVPPGSYVLDVKVIRGNYHKSEFSPKMTEQMDQHAAMYINYCKNVYQKYEQLINEKKSIYGSLDKIRTTGPCHRHVTDCGILVRHSESGRNKLSYRKLPIDQYRIEVTLGTVLVPGMGSKLTDKSAAKGVSCLILPDEHMPVDKYGNRADVISDPNSTISRMNNARADELYLGAACRDNWMRLVQTYTQHYGPHFIENMPDEAVEEVRAFLAGFYKLINSESENHMLSLNPEEVRQHLHKFNRLTMLEIFYPTDNERNIVDVIDSIEASIYAPLCDKVTYVNGKGETKTTVEDVRIGRSYIMFLEKIANTYSAVSSSKVNNFGFPVKGTNVDKHRYPHSLTPTKLPGETEKRIFASFLEPEGPAEIQDLAMSPNSHKTLYRHALESDKAFDTEFNINRSEIDYGQTTSLQLLHHVFVGAGFDFEHRKGNDQ